MFHIIQHGTGLAVGAELGAALVLELLVGDGEDDGAVVTGERLGLQVEAIFFAGFMWVGPGVVDVNPGAVVAQFLDEVDNAGVAQVGAVFLEGEAEDENGSVEDG